MVGATATYKENLRKATLSDPSQYDLVVKLAAQVLDGLPSTSKIGSLSAALMLAATAYSEFGVAAARALVKETRDGKR